MIIVSPDFLIFDRELVIISDLLPDSYWLLRVDHDLVLPINLDHFGVAVWLQNKVGKYRVIFLTGPPLDLLSVGR